MAMLPLFPPRIKCKMSAICFCQFPCLVSVCFLFYFGISVLFLPMSSLLCGYCSLPIMCFSCSSFRALCLEFKPLFILLFLVWSLWFVVSCVTCVTCVLSVLCVPCLPACHPLSLTDQSSLATSSLGVMRSQSENKIWLDKKIILSGIFTFIRHNLIKLKLNYFRFDIDKDLNLDTTNPVSR